MKFLLKLIRRGLALLAILLLLATATLAGLLWITLPPARQSAAIPGLGATVDITFDPDGVARIRAGNALDAAAALGFVHARDRMFQMELMRRAASGRLSELFGPATIGFDASMRTLGLRQSALADFAELPPATRAVLEAYSRGVNAWIAARGRFSAPEFIAFGTPEPWTPVDCLLWEKTLGLWLSGNYRVELARLALAGKLTPAQIQELWPAPHAQPGADAALDHRYAAAAAGVLGALPRFPARFTLPATASNEWAVDGSHSATGAPLLAGDPHLGFSLPGIWYLARIDTPQETLAGATAPGVPFLVIGHNAHIAWSFTSNGAAVQDVFEETPVDADHYLGPDGPLAYGLREERIRVRGNPDTLLTVRATRHGPVISDLSSEPGRVLAVEMANLAPHDTAASGLLALNQAADLDQAGAAAALITAPVQNLLVADPHRIGLFVTGRVPIRRAGDGSVPVPGASGADDWTGLAAGGQLPRFIAPASGRLVNANERVAPADFPLPLGHDWYGDWRARRIRQLLARSDRLTVQDFTAMQNDAVSLYAQDILPVLRAVPVPEGLAARALALLTGWDGAMARGAAQPLIYNAWLHGFHAALAARAGIPNRTPASPWMEFTAFVLTDPAGAAWCGGDCRPLLASTLQTAMAELAARYGADPARWRWGEAHPAVFANQLLHNIPLLDPIAVARVPARGDDATIDRGGMGPDSLDDIHGASYRGVYDLADLDRSRFMLAPGQSGNPFSRHARDFLRRWSDGETIPLGPEPARVSARITLTP